MSIFKRNNSKILFFATLMMVWMLSVVPLFADKAAELPNKVIKSAAEYDYPPFSIIEKNGDANGFSIELLRAALKVMGHGTEFKVGSWAKVKGLLKQGKIDALPLVGRTPEREPLFDFTFPYLSLHGAIIIRKETKGIHNVQCFLSDTIVIFIHTTHTSLGTLI